MLHTFRAKYLHENVFVDNIFVWVNDIEYF